MAQQMEKFFNQKDLEKRTGKDVIFVETNFQLESTTSFSQYIFKDIRLITLVSELHDQHFSCKDPSLTIDQYCKMAVMRNTKCKIMLEYNQGDDPTRIGSHAVRSTYDTLKKAGKDNQIIPFDSRMFFLTPRGQNDLYGSGFSYYDTPQKIEDMFIKPFYEKWNNDPALFSLHGDYDKNICEYLVNSYFTDIKHSFEHATSSLKTKSPQEVNKILKDSWKKVADFFILRDILKNDTTDEYIVVLGDSHRKNIQQILSNSFTTQLNNKTGKQGDCINLFQTYLI
jgi:hypothetical protein